MGRRCGQSPGTRRESGDRPVSMHQSRRATGGAGHSPSLPDFSPTGEPSIHCSGGARLNTFILLAAVAGAHPIEPVVVTATRTEIPASQALASVELITREELQRSPASDLGDALRLRAGVEVARLGGPGQQTSLFLRGTESNHVLVLVDGLRINPGTIGSAAIQNIAPELVERDRDRQGSALDALRLGGARRRDQRDHAPRRGERRERAGWFRRLRHAQRQPQRRSLRRARRRVRRRVLARQRRLPDAHGDATDRGYENRSFTAAARTDLGAVELGFRAWHAEGTSEYSDFFVTPVDQDFENSALALTAAFAPAESWDARLMLGYAVDDLEQNQSPDFLDTRRYTLDWQNDIRADRAPPADGGAAVAGRRGGRRVLRPAVRRHDDHDSSSTCRTRPRSARIACSWLPATPTTRLSAVTRRGTRNTALRSASAPSSPSPPARPSARRMRPTCTVSAATRNWKPRSRRATRSATASASASASRSR